MILIGHIEYFATGEGLTQITFASFATDKQTFINRMSAKVNNPYLMEGVDIYDYDDITKNNKISRNLPRYILDRIEQIKNSQGYFELFLQDYVNYS